MDRMNDEEIKALAEKAGTVAAYLVAVLLLILAFAVVTWLVCWGFGIDWSWRYAVGAAAAVVVVRMALARS